MAEEPTDQPQISQNVDGPQQEMSNLSTMREGILFSV